MRPNGEGCDTHGTALSVSIFNGRSVPSLQQIACRFETEPGAARNGNRCKIKGMDDSGDASPTTPPDRPAGDTGVGAVASDNLAASADCWFLTGTTASGKTEVGLALARRLGAEIISMDSMALFRGMDIGTAKPSREQQAASPHHLIDVVDPWEDYSLAQYLEAAGRCAEEIRQRGRKILFVGGTPLYLKGLLRGIFEGPPADWALRSELGRLAETEGPEALHTRLGQVDPEAAARLHPNDVRRVLRALEVHALTGHPISRLQRQFQTGLSAQQCRVFVLQWPRAEIHARIDRRVEAMFVQGLVEEVRRLAESGRPLSRTARQAVGYAEVLDHLAGTLDLPTTVDLVQQHTRQLAKRQETWFRSLSECRFVPMSEEAPSDEVAAKVAENEFT